MSYQIQMSRVQLERVVRALELLEQTETGEQAATKYEQIDPESWDGEDVRYLLGCAQSTLTETEDDTLHGWNL